MDQETKPIDDTTQESMDAHCLSGIKLYGVLSGIMIATMLISLDVSIIATVS